MASYAVGAGENGAWAKVLTASTVDTVTFTRDLSSVEVFNEGPGAVYFTVNGSTPVVGSSASWYVPVNGVRSVESPEGSGTVVKLISSVTPTYSVSGD